MQKSLHPVNQSKPRFSHRGYPRCTHENITKSPKPPSRPTSFSLFTFAFLLLTSSFFLSSHRIVSQATQTRPFTAAGTTCIICPIANGTQKTSQYRRPSRQRLDPPEPILRIPRKSPHRPRRIERTPGTPDRRRPPPKTRPPHYPPRQLRPRIRTPPDHSHPQQSPRPNNRETTRPRRARRTNHTLPKPPRSPQVRMGPPEMHRTRRRPILPPDHQPLNRPKHRRTNTRKASTLEQNPYRSRRTISPSQNPRTRRTGDIRTSGRAVDRLRLRPHRIDRPESPVSKPPDPKRTQKSPSSSARKAVSPTPNSNSLSAGGRSPSHSAQESSEQKPPQSSQPQ